MKSLITNAVSILLIVVGYFSPYYKQELMTMGWFAFSGAITNWLAIYMLFEKVPFLYGSGVIPQRFEEFKAGIRSMMMGQFFSFEQVQKFIHAQVDQMENKFDLSPLLEGINLDDLFQRLINVIMQSSFGGMLGMMGGAKALEGLRTPFKENVLQFFIELKDQPQMKEKFHSLFNKASGSDKTNEFVEKIQTMVDARLNELTPQKVKEIIQDMIRVHLGWLVVWGGVFGAIIGLLSCLF